MPSQTSDNKDRVSERTASAQSPEDSTVQGDQSSKTGALTPATRPRPPKVKVEKEEGKPLTVSLGSTHYAGLARALGTEDRDSIEALLVGLANSTPSLDNNVNAVNFALATV